MPLVLDCVRIMETVSSVCVNTASKELVLGRRFEVPNSHSELKDPMNHQTLKGYVSVKSVSYGGQEP